MSVAGFLLLGVGSNAIVAHISRLGSPESCSSRSQDVICLPQLIRAKCARAALFGYVVGKGL